MASFEARTSPIDERVTRRWLLPVSLPMVPPIVAVAEFLLVLLTTSAAIVLFTGGGRAPTSPSEAALSCGLLAAAFVTSASHARHLYTLEALKRIRRQFLEQTLIVLLTWILIASTTAALDPVHSVRPLTLALASACTAVAIHAHRLVWFQLICGEDIACRVRLQPVVLLTIGRANPHWLAKALADAGMQVSEQFHLAPRDMAYVAKRECQLRALADSVQRLRVSAVYVACDGSRRRALQAIAAELPELSVPVRVLSTPETELMPISGPSAPIRLGQLLAYELRRPTPTAAECLQKRLLDVVGATIALLLLAPLMIAVAIAIRLDSRGPIIFKQRRMGLHGNMFLIYKFRSMSVQEDGPSIQQARRNDPRVTRVGRVIRASSIDELPQLFNVLLGNMSLVGPRPHALAHEDYYEALISGYGLRRRMKPGMTGWAQINGHRGETPTTEHMRVRVYYDLWYVQNWSIWLDLRILLMTPLALRG